MRRIMPMRRKGGKSWKAQGIEEKHLTLLLLLDASGNRVENSQT